MCCSFSSVHGVFHINHIKAEKSGKFPYEKETRYVRVFIHYEDGVKGGTTNWEAFIKNEECQNEGKKKRRIMELNIHDDEGILLEFNLVVLLANWKMPKSARIYNMFYDVQ